MMLFRAPDETSSRPGARPTVLIVDDDADTRESLRTVVGLSLPGVQLEMAATAQEALHILGHRPVDVLLTDHVLPDRSGLDLIQECSASNPRLPILLMTGHGDMMLAARAVNEAHVEGLFPKPLDHQALLSSLRRVLRIHAGKPGRIPPSRPPDPRYSGAGRAFPS
jgi:two-component system C4-dicarboxylate transport response regulator DctD